MEIQLEENPLHQTPSRMMFRINSISTKAEASFPTILDLESNKLLEETNISEADETVLTEKWIVDNAITRSHVKGPMVLKGNGCTYRMIKLNDEDQPRFVFLLFDWMKLWNCFSHCSHDALAEQVPLLAASLKVFLKGNVVVLSMLINLYLTAVLATTFKVYGVTTMISTYTQLAVMVCVLIGYGTLKGYSATRMTPEAMQMKDLNVNFRDFAAITYKEMKKLLLPIINGTLNIKKLQIGSDKKELAEPYIRRSEMPTPVDDTKELHTVYRKLKKFGVTRVDGYLDVCNMATYYLTTLKSDTFAFKPRMYTHLYLLIFIVVVPLGILSQIVSAWMVTMDCIYAGHTGFYGGDPYCNNAAAFTIFTLGGAVSFVAAGLLYMQMICVFGVLIYGADVSFALTEYWMLRFFALRKISTGDESDEKSGSKDEEEGKADLFGGQLEKKEFFSAIKRDAFERYLLVNNIFVQTSEIWSVALSIFLILCAAIAIEAYISFLYYYFVPGSISIQSIATLAGVIAISFLIVYCVAHANGAIDNITLGFTYCGMEDYGILGSRSDWKEYVADAPIYWYIFGFPITKQWVTSFISGGVTTIVGTITVSKFIPYGK